MATGQIESSVRRSEEFVGESDVVLTEHPPRFSKVIRSGEGELLKVTGLIAGPYSGRVAKVELDPQTLDPLS